MKALALKHYLESVDLRSLLTELGAQNIQVMIEGVRHFTEKEAKKRDKIILDYFGKHGVNQIVDAIISRVNMPPKLGTGAKILDIGAGSGFFTLMVESRLKKQGLDISFYAMDATPAMLLALAKKTGMITPFFGIAENIAGSIQKAKEYAEVPERFDAVFSTLMLHHCPDINRVFQSVRRVLKPTGKAIIVDLCTHSFTEFREEMGDLHLGFDPEEIRKIARKSFSKVSVEKMAGICCSSSGRSAELFIATMKP